MQSAHISRAMTRSYTRLAWSAAACTYLLIILGAIVRITGSGMGCGDHWPLCNGKLLPPLDLPTLIEYGHRLAAALVSVLVSGLAAYAWWLRRGAGSGERYFTSGTAYVALGLLIVQVLLGAVTVKLDLPPWTVIVHLGTAMLLLATLIVAARGPRVAPPSRAWLWALALGFVTVLLGALTANLGAASACLGFPLCNGQIVPDGNYLQYIQWTHRLLAYTLFGYSVWWAWRTRARTAWAVVALVTLQVAVAAAMVLLGLPRPLQALHVAVGAGVWAGIVITAGERAGKGPGKGEGPLPLSPAFDRL
jgi:heme A synthase